MADINQVITLGIGTPSDIEHLILFGLNGTTVVPGSSFTPARTVEARPTRPRLVAHVPIPALTTAGAQAAFRQLSSSTPSKTSVPGDVTPEIQATIRALRD